MERDVLAWFERLLYSARHWTPVRGHLRPAALAHSARNSTRDARFGKLHHRVGHLWALRRAQQTAQESTRLQIYFFATMFIATVFLVFGSLCFVYEAYVGQ